MQFLSSRAPPIITSCYSQRGLDTFAFGLVKLCVLNTSFTGSNVSVCGYYSLSVPLQSNPDSSLCNNFLLQSVEILHHHFLLYYRRWCIYALNITSSVLHIPPAFHSSAALLWPLININFFEGLVFDLVRAVWTNLRWISHYSAARITGRAIPRSDRNALIPRFSMERYFCLSGERWMIMWWSGIDDHLSLPMMHQRPPLL